MPDSSISDALLQAIGRGMAQGLFGQLQPRPEPEPEPEPAAAPRPARAARPARKAGPRRARRARSARPGRAAKATKVTKGSKRLSSGDYVYYRQGRGKFLAKVTGVDAGASTAVVRRVTDGKKVERPLAKLRRAPAP